jgi:hypothetical protein
MRVVVAPPIVAILANLANLADRRRSCQSCHAVVVMLFIYPSEYRIARIGKFIDKP